MPYPNKCSNQEDLRKDWELIKKDFEYNDKVAHILYRLEWERPGNPNQLPLIPQEGLKHKYLITKDNIDELFEISEDGINLEEFLEEYCEFNEFGVLSGSTEEYIVSDKNKLINPESYYNYHLIENDPTLAIFSIIFASGGPNQNLNFYWRITHDEENYIEGIDIEKVTMDYSWWSFPIEIDLTDDDWIQSTALDSYGCDYEIMIQEVEMLWEEHVHKLNNDTQNNN